jgi:hypothetical protein
MSVITKRWPDSIFGSHDLQDDGTPLERRSIINLIGFTITDNEAGDAYDVEGGGGAADPYSVVTPAAVAGTGSVGVESRVARGDHVHAHGTQAGGTTHANAVAAGAAGFMTGADKTKLDGITSGATANVAADATPLAVGTAAIGVSTDYAREDHVHAHGNQLGGTLHADAGASAGFMSAADKTKLDASTENATASTLVQRGSDGIRRQIKTAIGATLVVGDHLQNTTAAADGAQQWSPATEWTGYGWDVGSGASVVLNWWAQNRTTQGAEAATSALHFLKQKGAGGITSVFVIDSAAASTFALGLAITGDLTVTGTIKGATQVSAVKTAAYTAELDEIVRCDPSGGAFDVDLPTAVGATGRAVTVKNVTTSTTAITVDPNGAETVDGAAGYSMTTAYGSATFISDGANWMAFPAA